MFLTQCLLLLLLLLLHNRKTYRYILPWDALPERSGKDWIAAIRTAGESSPVAGASQAMKEFVVLFAKSPYYGSWFSRVSVSFHNLIFKK